MKTGEIIGTLAAKAGLNLRQLAIKSGIPYNTLYAIVKRKSDRIDPETLQRIAAALGVSVTDLMFQSQKDETKDHQWFALEQKLASAGFSLGFYEDDAVLWVNYPDGTLEVSEAELLELNDSADSYLRFKLQELREKYQDRFKPKK